MGEKGGKENKIDFRKIKHNVLLVIDADKKFEEICMKFVAVVLSSNTSFKEMFNEDSPFVGGISYWTYMLKTELEKLNIRLVEYRDSEKRINYKYYFHFDRFRKDVIEKNPKAIHIYLGFEPQVVEISHTPHSLKRLAKYVYDAVITIRTDIEGERIFSVTLPNDLKYVGSIADVPDGLGCLLSGDKVGFGRELYSKRREIIKYAEANEDCSFAFFGPSWKKPYSKYRTYKGHAENKLDLAKKYKFNFCLENEYGTPGGISEKIFDSMSVGMVPVYYGAPDIEKYVPSDCYIDFHLFNSVEECFEYLKSIPDSEYLEMKRKIKDFMESAESKERFSAKNMASTIQHIISEYRYNEKRKLFLLSICKLKKYVYFLACYIKRMVKR